MDDLRAGIENMLVNCAGLRAGQSLLILAEDPSEGHYDPDLAPRVAEVARAAGIAVRLVQVPFDPVPKPPSPGLLAQMRRADRALFLARIGDQLRFDAALAARKPEISYALDCGMMASRFGRADHRAFVALRDCLNAAFARAARIHVTCPLGTDFVGPGARFPATGGEVTVRRFPMSVFTPVPCAGHAGRVAVAGFLTGTGKTLYAPQTLPLDDVLFVAFEGDRITGFDGTGGDPARAAAHYRHVGAVLDIDPWHLHSWHAGIHPGCGWRDQAGANVVRWGGGAFGNPRLLHFHSCGALPPGEISLNVVDPTIRLDGVPVWERGRLFPDRVPGGAEILARYPSAAEVFENPARNVGLAPSGRLSARVEPQPGTSTA